jgi:Ca2+/Na+ antiporter
MHWQLKLLLLLGVICLMVILLVDFRGIQSVLVFTISFLFVFFGHKLYEGENSENWLNFSFFSSAKNAVGSVLILFGWIIFLRGVLAVAIASVLLRLG